MREKFKSVACSAVLAGIIVALIGLYFWMFKAGLPYQDPTTEMTIRWMAYNFAGKTCLSYGTVISLIGVIGLAFLNFHNRKK